MVVGSCNMHYATKTTLHSSSCPRINRELFLILMGARAHFWYLEYTW